MSGDTEHAGTAGDDRPGAGGSRPARAPRTERRRQAVCDVLRAYVRDQAMEHFGARTPRSGTVSMTLRFDLRPDDGWAVNPAPPLEAQVLEQLQEQFAQLADFRPGRVFCFRCGGSDCAHSLPPGPLHVFRGFGQTGEPEWCEFAQALLDARDPRVERLFTPPVEVLACVRMGRELRARQLAPFGRSSRTYAVLGQVAAGYFSGASEPTRVGHQEPAERFAVTFQAVETREADGRVRFRLNAIAGGFGNDAWEEWLAGDRQTRFSDAVDQARRGIEDITASAAAARESGRSDLLRSGLRRIPSLLAGLAREIERGARSGRRRTKHAELRRRDLRPVHKAFEDAARATDERLFADDRPATRIALGAHGRAHVFSPAGKHVTSFTLPHDGAEQRLRTGRWRRMTPEEILVFRRALRHVSHHRDNETHSDASYGGGSSRG